MTTRQQRAQTWLQDHPWALGLGSAVFVLVILLLAADADWDLGAPVGGAVRHAPLWVVLLLGLPLFGAGIVIGIVRQVQRVRRRVRR